MADSNFIPLNQSTPVQGRWQGKHHNQRGYNPNNRFQGGPRKSGNYSNRWGNNSNRNSSFGSDSNSSFGREQGIDAYLHPSMLQDPWAKLRQSMETSSVEEQKD